jgi:hypothetical protein
VTPGVWRTTDQLHAHEHVTRNAHAGDHLALAVLDLDDIFHRHLDLVDVLLDLERRLALLDVGLHLALETGVGVDDVPLALEDAQLGAELGVGVLVLFFGLSLSLFGGLLDELAVLLGVFSEDLGRGLGLAGLVDLECVVHDGVCLRVFDVDVFVVGKAGTVVDMHRPMFCGLAREFVPREDAARLGLVVLAGLLRGRSPISVVEMLFRHDYTLFRFTSECRKRRPQSRRRACRIRTLARSSR